MKYRAELYDSSATFNELHYPMTLDGWRVHSFAAAGSWVIVLWEKEDNAPA